LTVINALEGLFDNRAFIEFPRDIVRGGADEFGAVFIGLATRLCAP